MKRLRLPSILTLLALAAALSYAGAAPAKPNLQGKWKLNEDLTARMRETDRPRGGGRFGGGRFPGGGRRGGGFPGGPPRDRDGEGRRSGGPRTSFAALDELTITQKEGEVTITDKDGHARVLKTDGTKMRYENAPAGPVELRANWEKDGTLTVKVKPDEGRPRTESWVVSNDGKHLYVTLTVQGDGTRPDFKFRRAYDPAT